MTDSRTDFLTVRQPLQGRSRAQSAAALVLSLAIVAVAAATGSLFMPDAWYRGLAKPWFNPPDWVFGPVWSTLYLMMAIAAWLVWRERGLAGARLPLGLFAVQLVLNAGWTALFFGRHALLGALVEIAVLWITILATCLAFWRIKPAAGALLVPYLAWVGFASLLSLTLWRLNG